MELERRTVTTGLEIRQEADKPPRIVGHAAVFNQVADLGFFKEQVAPGAFKDTLTDDVRALVNHDPGYVLGRTTAGTLRLAEDQVGLAVEIDPPETQWAKDLLESIRRGDVTGMSFAFEAVDEAWEVVQGSQLRTLKAVKLRDVSVVTFPAYEQTDVSLRAKDHAQKAQERKDSTMEENVRVEETQAETRQVMAEVAASVLAAPADERRAAFVRFLRTGETRALGEATAAAGGVLAPAGFQAEVLKARQEAAVMRRLARVIGPISNAQLDLPRSLTGVTAAWLAENAAITPGDPTFDKLTFVPHKMGALTLASNELLGDQGVDVEAFLAQLFGEALGKLEDQAFFSGTGTGQPKGVLTDTGVPSVTAAAAAALALDDVLAVYDLLPPQYRDQATWVMNPGTMAVLRKLKDTTGRLLLTSDLSGAAPATILGRPVVLTSNMPALAANAKTILFGDFSAGYLIVDRLGLDVQRSTDRYFESDQTAFRAIARTDGQVAIPDALAVLKMAAA